MTKLGTTSEKKVVKFKDVLKRMSKIQRRRVYHEALQDFTMIYELHDLGGSSLNLM